MSADRQSDFLARARELWEAAAVLRARGVAEGDPALGV